MNWYDNKRDFFYEEQKTIEEGYPGLHFGIKDDKMHLSGKLSFQAVYADELIEDCYDVDILFPDNYPDDLPVVWETGEKIERGYHHFSDGTLCLGTFVEVHKIFSASPCIKSFIESLLIPYLYRYSYIEKFKKAPFAESAHGIPGIIQWYQNYFEIDDVLKILNLLSIIIKHKYKGHLRCPCGSNERLRKCHGPRLIKLLDVPQKYLQIEVSCISKYTAEPGKRLGGRNKLEMLKNRDKGKVINST